MTLDCKRIGRVISLRVDGKNRPTLEIRDYVSLNGRRKIAGWDDDERMRLLGITPL